MKPNKKISRLLLLLLCALLVIPLLAAAFHAKLSAEAAGSVFDHVRVGLCLPEKDTEVFVSSAKNASGFTVGKSSGRSFQALFDTASVGLALFPDKNAKLSFENGTATGRHSDSGNYGAYNIRTDKHYTGYAEARTAANKYDGGFVAYVNGSYEVRYGSFTTEAEAKKAIGGKSGLSVAVPANGGISAVDCNTGKIVFEFKDSDLLAIRSKNGSAVSLNTTESRTDYLGFFTMEASSCMKVINVVDIETYVKCVMANEIGTNVSVETRRAFSVLIRTVPLNSKHASYGCDVCNSNCCQVYLGNFRRDSENDAIVDSTKGEYITYEGSPISCLYHSSNGGASCSSVAAWGGVEVPYLTSVTLKEDAENPSEIWQYTFTENELYEFLASRSAFDGLSGGISSVTIEETDPYGSGYVTLLSVTDKNLNKVAIETSEDVRKALRFDSANFTVSYSAQATVLGADGKVENTTVGGYIDANGEYREFDSFKEYEIAGSKETFGADQIVFDGVGSGHGVGFSHVGSEQLVAEGYSYRYIIQFYFQGTEISRIS